MSSWFGDGLTSLKGQLSNFAKALAEESHLNPGAESSQKGQVLEGQEDDKSQSDENVGSEEQKSSDEASSNKGSGWTDIQLVHPSHSASENEEEEEDVQKDKETNQEEKSVKDHVSSTNEVDKDVGSIIRGGIANLFQISRDFNSSQPSTKSITGISHCDREVQTDLSQDGTTAFIASLEERINFLTQENDSLSMSVANLGQAAADLEAQVAVSQDENSNLSTGLEELDIQHQRAIENIMVVRDETLREYETLKARYAELEKELAIMKAIEERKAKEKEIDNGREEELIIELEDRDRELECLEGENASLRETLKDLIKEQENSKDTLATISEHDGEELEAMEKQVEQLKLDLTTAMNDNIEKDKQLEKLNNDVLSLIAERDRTSKQIEEQLKNQESALEIEKNKNTQLKNDAAELEEELSLMINAKTEYESLIEHLESKLDSSNLSADLNIIPFDVQDKINSLEEENRLLHSKLEFWETRLEELNNQKDHLQKECETKDRKMCQILLESNAVEKECKVELEKQEMLHSQLLDEYKSFREESNNENKQKELEIVKLKSRIEADNEIIVDNALSSELSEKLTLLEQENETLMAESGGLKLERDELTLKIKELNENLKKADNDLSTAKNESQILKKQYQFDLRTMESKLNDLSQESQQYHIDKEVFNQKEIEFKNQIKLKDEEISAFKTFKIQSETVFKDKLSSLECEYKGIIDEKDKKLETVKELQNEIDSLKSSLEEKSKSYEETIQIIETGLNETKNKLESSVTEKENLIAELSKLKQEFTSLSSQKLESETEQYEQEKEILLRKIESITEQKAQLLSDIVRLNAEHSNFKKQLEQSHSEEIKSLQANLELVQNKLKSTKNELMTKSQDLQTKLTHAETERDELFKNIQLKHNESISFQTEVLRLHEFIKAEQSKMETLVVDKAQLEVKCEKLQPLQAENETNKKEISELSQEVVRLKEQLDNASELLKETKRTEAEGQSAEDTSSAKNFKCAEGCAKTQEGYNQLSWALHNEQINSKSLQRQLADIKEKFEKSEVQLRRLQVHLVEIEQNQTEEQVELEQMKSKLQIAEERLRQSSTAFTSSNIRANQQVESLSHQVQMLTETKSRLETELSNAEDSVLKQQAAVTNLQAVLHQFQLDKQRDVEFETERLRQHLNESQDRYEQLNAEMRKTMDQMNEMKKGLEAASRLSEQLNKKSQVVETMKTEATLLKEKLEKEKLKVNEIHSSVEGKVDRNLVKNLIVGYMLTDDKSKGQVLRVLASVLDMDAEDRKKLALEPQSQKQQQSLSEAFIKFLESESQPKPQLVLSVPQTPEGSTSRRTSQSSNSSVLLSTEATSTLSHSPVIPAYPIRSNHSILKDLLKDATPGGGNNS